MTDMSALALELRYPWYGAARDALLQDIELIKAGVSDFRQRPMCPKCGHRFKNGAGFLQHMMKHDRRGE